MKLFRSVRSVETVSIESVRWLRSKHADWVLAAVSFTESVFAPILIDPFLVALILARRERWVRYIVIATLSSVLGGLVAYFLGLLFFEYVGAWLITMYGFEEQFLYVSEKLDSNGFVFVLLGALTPIPYKLVAIASGVGQINVVTFLFASVVGRALRMGLVGGATYLVGPHAILVLRKHLLTFAYMLGAVLVLYLIIRFF